MSGPSSPNRDTAASERDRLIDAALAMPGSERARFVASQAGVDSAVLAEVQRALAEADRDDEFLRPGTALQSPLFASLLDEPDVPEPRPAMADGARVGRYVVTGFLGAGGMGEVYRARDTRLARDVALKVLPVHVRLEPDRAARLRREARVLAALNHPHVAALYDFEESDDVIALVLELVKGETLAARLGRGALPMPEAFAIARQVAEGMAAAHARGIVHCDLKPANVAFDRDGRVRILDFGIATVVRDVADVSASQVPVLTTTPGMSGGRIGTIRYMSPEQLRGEDVDPRSDVWAFGCLCFELVTGVFAFDGSSSADTMVRVLAGDVPLDRLPDDTPPAWRSLVGRCFATSAVERLSGMREAITLIDLASEQFTAGLRAASPPTIAPRTWLAGHRTALIAMALALGGLAALGLGWLLRATLEGAR